MLVVLPCHPGDVKAAGALLRWIARLGPCRGHRLLIVPDPAVDWGDGIDLLSIARPLFDVVTVEPPPAPIKPGWPTAVNAMFAHAATVVAEQRLGRWLWLEPDAIPLRPGWLDALAAASEGRAYTGCVVKDAMLKGLPFVYLNGVAIYPEDAATIMLPACDGKAAFDVASAAAVVPQATHTDLIQVHWGQPDLPPTFVATPTPGRNHHLTLDFIRSGAVLFHRCKDGSLPRLLAARLFPGDNRFVVVYAFCHKDAPLMLANLRWQAKLEPHPQDMALLVHDRSVAPETMSEIHRITDRLYGAVENITYNEPRGMSFYDVSKFAFGRAAQTAQRLARPWFWHESDIWPLRRGWLDTLQTEYAGCGKPFMGSYIAPMGHMNGTGIFPVDCWTRCNSLRSFKNGAFDTDMKDETKGLIHDASHFMHHAWCTIGGRLRPWGNGPTPSFADRALFEQIPKQAVTFHRCKDDSLLRHLKP